MGLKITLKRHCERCGQPQLRFTERDTVWVWHKCTNPIPGPSSPPREHRLCDVLVEPGDAVAPDPVKTAAEPGPADAAPKCPRCEGPGSAKTFENQVCMPISGRVQCIDWCIHQIVASLNAGGIETVASCCGHGTIPGRIDLKGGRVLTLQSSSSAITPSATEEKP